jgi:peptidoglycan/LPS O-acetylase OafA/YrhL
MVPANTDRCAAARYARETATSRVGPPRTVVNDSIVASSDGARTQHIAGQKYRADVDGLRAVAVLLVVGFHAFPEWIGGGLIGVDVFFVISGFLISTIIISGLERGTFSFLGFYSRRIRRIFPALLVVLVASLAIGWFLLLPDTFAQLGKHIAGAAGFVSNFVLWDESGYFDQDSIAKPLLHLWSLGIEEQFYLVWPLVLWLAWSRRLNLPITILSLIAISFTLNVVTIQDDATADFYAPYTRAWELLAGALLASLVLERPHLLAQASARQNLLSALGATLLLAGAVLISRSSSFPGWWAVLPVLGATLLLLASDRAWLNRRVLAHPVLVWIGLISYPLYLWHWALLSFAHSLQDDSADPSVIVRTTIVLGSVALAWATYRFVETPLRFGSRGGAKVTVLVSAMALVGALGLTCNLLDGFGFRFPQAVRDLTAFSSYDSAPIYREGSCLLLPNQDASGFAKCPAQEVPGRPTLFLWGDSHAAHLYPGYLTTFGDDFNLVQRTAAFCPPLLGLSMANRPLCKSINDHVFDEIATLRPAVVVLSAAWRRYPFWPDYLVNTIERLRRAGVRRIDLVGPVPDWHATLPHILSKTVGIDPSHRIPPARTTKGLGPPVFAIDKALRDAAARTSVNYVSPATILCNDEGCLVQLDDSGKMPMQWDRDHLTLMGSRYLVSKFPRD